LVHCKPKARVETRPSGSGTIKMHAKSAVGSSVLVNGKSGSSSAQCYAQEPPKKKQAQRKPTASGPILLLPPWDSTKL